MAKSNPKQTSKSVASKASKILTDRPLQRGVQECRRQCLVSDPSQHQEKVNNL